MGDSPLDERLIPALHRRTADAVRVSQLALADTSIMGLKDLQAVSLGGPYPGKYPGETMPEISTDETEHISQH